MFDSWQQDSSRCALQYEIISCVTMATYWVPDRCNVFFLSDLLRKHINVFWPGWIFLNWNSLKYWKQDLEDWKRECYHGNNLIISVGTRVTFRTTCISVSSLKGARSRGETAHWGCLICGYINSIVLHRNWLETGHSTVTYKGLRDTIITITFTKNTLLRLFWIKLNKMVQQ